MKRSLDGDRISRKRKKCENQTVSVDDDSNSSITTPDLRSDEEAKFAPLPLSQSVQKFFGRGDNDMKNLTKVPFIPLDLPAIPELPELPTTAERPVGGINQLSALITDDNKEKTGSDIYQAKNEGRFENHTSDPSLIVDTTYELDMSMLPEPSPSVSSPEPTPIKKGEKAQPQNDNQSNTEVSDKTAVSPPRQRNVRNTVILEKHPSDSSQPPWKRNDEIHDNKLKQPTSIDPDDIESKATILDNADSMITPSKPIMSLNGKDMMLDSPVLLDPKDLPDVDSGQDTDVSPQAPQQPLPTVLSKQRLLAVQRDLVRGYKEVVTSEGGISDAKLGALLLWLGVPRVSVERHVRRILRRPGKIKSRTNLRGILRYFNRVFT